LIALWVLCEALLGGIIHGLKLPVSGLVVGSGAIICICLIAYYVPMKGAIIKATVIVAIFKMMLSPHSPPTAYVAVFFQGCLGQLLFLNLRFFKFSCLVLGFLSMIESAVQRIFVLIILYGTNLWNAVDQYLSKLTNQEIITNYTLMIAAGYILLHAVVGLLVGGFSANIATKSKEWISMKIFFEEAPKQKTIEKFQAPSRSKRIMRLSFFIIWILLIIAFLQSITGFGNPIIPAHVSLQILFRSFLIVLTWYFLISPIVLAMMKKRLEKQKENNRGDIQQVMLILPSIKYLVSKSWQMSEGERKFARLKMFLKILLVNLLHYKNG
jgi:hypothetical protein